LDVARRFACLPKPGIFFRIRFQLGVRDELGRYGTQVPIHRFKIIKFRQLPDGTVIALLNSPERFAGPSVSLTEVTNA
jgi:hypothetical protein